MRARAPGKLVLSGAYAVLYGAPALVVAVDRYVVADSEREPSFRAPEVLAALARDPRLSQREPPHFDASALRSGGRKLGLGSSAAITAASIAALVLSRDAGWEVAGARSEYAALAAQPADGALAARVFPAALGAHRAAQPGGSGVDVAAACFGGTLLARLGSLPQGGPAGLVAPADLAEPRGTDAGSAAAVGSASAEHAALNLERAVLPPGLQVDVFWSGRPASTQQLLGLVRSLEAAQPARFSQLMGAQIAAADAAADAICQGNAAALLTALHAQCAALDALGQAAGAAIVGPGLRELAASAEPAHQAWLPAGAGGGDVSVRFSLEGSTIPDTSAIRRAGERLELSLSARGVHAWS